MHAVICAPADIVLMLLSRVPTAMQALLGNISGNLTQVLWLDIMAALSVAHHQLHWAQVLSPRTHQEPQVWFPPFN